MPIGIAPMGGAALGGFQSDAALARAAAKARVPFILSGAASIALEALRALNPDLWMQAYLANDQALNLRYLDRLARAGVGTLVITLDLPTAANRENNLRNGYRMPLRLDPALVWQGLSHPRWLLGTGARTLWRGGIPHLENMGPERGGPILSFAKPFAHQPRDGLSWAMLKELRAHWQGNLVLKGVMRAEDVTAARDLGAQGVIVSNHGGRQLDHIASPLRDLRQMVAAAGTMAIYYDGGVRRASDAIKALALGAKAVFVGRPLLYATSVAGEAGALLALSLLEEEFLRNLAMLGARDCAALGPHLLKEV